MFSPLHLHNDVSPGACVCVGGGGEKGNEAITGTSLAIHFEDMGGGGGGGGGEYRYIGIVQNIRASHPVPVSPPCHHPPPPTHKRL